MNKLDDVLNIAKIGEFLGKKEEKKTGEKVIWALAIIGSIAAVAAIAYAVYRYFTPDYMEDFDDDFDDDFEDDFFDDEEEKKEEPVVEK